MEESAVEVLQRNDPATTKINIFLSNERSHAEELAQALSANDFIVLIYLDLDDLRDTDNWSSVLNVIATREKLDTVILAGRNVAPPLTLLDAAAIRPFLQAIQQNPSVRTFTLHNLRLKGEVLSSFLDGAPFLQSLFFDSVDIEPSEVPVVAAALKRHRNITTLAFTDCCNGPSSLRILKGLTNMTVPLPVLLLGLGHASAGENRRFSLLLEAASKIKLLGLQILRVRTEEMFRQITGRIPQMQLILLGVGIPNGRHWTDAKRVFLAAVKQNFSLQSVSCSYHTDGLVAAGTFFDESEEKRLSFFMDRNLRLARWVENPALVPRHLWAEALKLALKAGKETLWRSLQTVLPEVGDIQHKRKRKRPRYYEPP